MDNSGLTKEEILNIQSIFSDYPQIEGALIYGSRAMGNHRPASDIDITLIGESIDLSLLTRIEFDLDDLLLLFKFDISIYHKISNPEFLDHIKRVGKEFYARKGNEDIISNLKNPIDNKSKPFVFHPANNPKLVSFFRLFGMFVKISRP